MRKGIYQLCHKLTIYFTDKRGKDHVLELKRKGEFYYGTEHFGNGTWDTAKAFDKVMFEGNKWNITTSRGTFLSDDYWINHSLDSRTLDEMSVELSRTIKIPFERFKKAITVTYPEAHDNETFKWAMDNLPASDFVQFIKDNNLFVKGA